MIENTATLRQNRLQSPEQKQIPQRLVFDRDVEVRGRNAHVCVAGRISHLGERSPTSERVANERMAAVMDREGPKAIQAERPTGGPEAI